MDQSVESLHHYVQTASEGPVNLTSVSFVESLFPGSKKKQTVNFSHHHTFKAKNA
jgi:hypothetical protein